MLEVGSTGSPFKGAEGHTATRQRGNVAELICADGFGLVV